MIAIRAFVFGCRSLLTVLRPGTRHRQQQHTHRLPKWRTKNENKTWL